MLKPCVSWFSSTNHGCYFIYIKIFQRFEMDEKKQKTYPKVLVQIFDREIKFCLTWIWREEVCTVYGVPGDLALPNGILFKRCLQFNTTFKIPLTLYYYPFLFLKLSTELKRVPVDRSSLLSINHNDCEFIQLQRSYLNWKEFDLIKRVGIAVSRYSLFSGCLQ